MGIANQEEWLQLPSNPDPRRDLGYEIEPWEVVDVENGESSHFVLFPTEEEMLRLDAFIIASTDSMETLDDCR